MHKCNKHRFLNLDKQLKVNFFF